MGGEDFDFSFGDGGVNDAIGPTVDEVAVEDTDEDTGPTNDPHEVESEAETSEPAPETEEAEEEEDDAEPAPEPAPEPEEVTEEKLQELLKDRKFAVKVAGEEMEVDFDELRRGYSHARAASMKMEEAAEVGKQAKAERDQIVAELRQLFGTTDAATKFDIMRRKVGIDPVDFATKLLSHHLELEAMTPEQRAIMNERDRLRQEQEQWRAEQQRIEEERRPMQERYYQEQIAGFINTAAAETGLPDTPATLQAVAQEMARLQGAGAIDQDLAHIAARSVKERIEHQTQTLMRDMGPEQLRAMLGDEAVGRLRQESINKVAGKKKAAPAPSRKKAREQPSRLNSLDDLEAQIYDRLLS